MMSPLNDGEPVRARQDTYSRLSLTRGLLGVLCLTMPARLSDVISRPRATSARRDVVAAGIWILGVRHVTEAVALTGYPVPLVRRAIGGVDVVHAASMVMLAAISSAYRRPALVAAAVASGLAALSVAAERQASRTLAT